MGEPPSYGEFHMAGNGESYMDFQMQITAVGVRDGASDKSIPLGTWKAGFDNNLTVIDPKIMKNYTADIVYRVITVIVGYTMLILKYS